jgi:alkanesulfonate monooxygenase SsuD/methylene tetrahydromethanopterin reductase-like flavin-dependent oxidoreductase (luciferase family)
MGVGLGYREPEFASFGVPLNERAPRFSEAIGLMRRLWTEDRVTQDGRFYPVKDIGLSLKPTRPGGPPVYIAAQVDAAIRRAARIGDAWLIVNATGLDKVDQQMRLYREALHEAGRTPHEYPIARECYVGANHATAYEECRAALEYKYNAYASWGLGASTAQPFEVFARDRFIIGDKVSVKEEVARYRERLGVDHFIMRCQWPGLPQERVLSSIKRLGEMFA